MVLCYVYYLIFQSSTDTGLNSYARKFLEMFHGSEKPLRWNLAVRIYDEDDLVNFSQCSYIKQSLETYDLTNVTLYTTPITLSFYDEVESYKEDPIISNTQYRNMICTLQLLSARTCPEISTAVDILSHYAASSNDFLPRSVKRVFLYLKATL